MQQLLTYMKMKRNRLKGLGKTFNLGLWHKSGDDNDISYFTYTTNILYMFQIERYELNPSEKVKAFICTKRPSLFFLSEKEFQCRKKQTPKRALTELGFQIWNTTTASTTKYELLLTQSRSSRKLPESTQLVIDLNSNQSNKLVQYVLTQIHQNTNKEIKSNRSSFQNKETHQRKPTESRDFSDPRASTVKKSYLFSIGDLVERFPGGAATETAHGLLHGLEGSWGVDLHSSRHHLVLRRSGFGSFGTSHVGAGTGI